MSRIPLSKRISTRFTQARTRVRTALQGNSAEGAASVRLNPPPPRPGQSPASRAPAPPPPPPGHRTTSTLPPSSPPPPPEGWTPLSNEELAARMDEMRSFQQLTQVLQPGLPGFFAANASRTAPAQPSPPPPPPRPSQSSASTAPPPPAAAPPANGKEQMALMTEMARVHEWAQSTGMGTSPGIPSWMSEGKSSTPSVTGPVMMEAPAAIAKVEDPVTPMQKMLQQLHMEEQNAAYQIINFEAAHKRAGWKVREGDQREFYMDRLDGREVAFVSRDENGRQVKHRGVVEPMKKGDPMSTVFRLNGGDEVFQTDFLDALAVRPEEPEAWPKPTAKTTDTTRSPDEQALLEGLDQAWQVRMFEKNHEEAGWQIGSDSDGDLWIGDLKGREVAFISRNEEGKQVYHRGVLGDSGSDDPAHFKVDGSDEVFNIMSLDALALAPKDPAAYLNW